MDTRVQWLVPEPLWYYGRHDQVPDEDNEEETALAGDACWHFSPVDSIGPLSDQADVEVEADAWATQWAEQATPATINWSVDGGAPLGPFPTSF